MNQSNPLVREAQLACARSDLARARQLFRAALQNDTQCITALHGLGVVSLQAEQPLRAVVLLERAEMLQEQRATANPSLKEALIFALNSALNKSAQKQQWERAILLGRRSIELQTNQASTLSNLAVAGLRTNQLDHALAWSQQAIECEPDNAHIVNNHASILQELGDFETAKQLYLKVLEQEPRHPNARSNLGCLKHQTGDLNQAQILYQTHLNHYPNDTRTWINLAGVFLSQNNWRSGWDAYQHRLDDPKSIMDVPPGLALWQNAKEPVRKLVVVHEQGLGDSFQFSRCLSGLPKHIRHVVFSGPSKLHGLLQHSGLIETCWDPKDPVFQWQKQDLNVEDRWIPLMNLVPLLQEQTDHCNAHYLVAEAESIRRWGQTLKPSDQQPLIGLHWQGNPEHEMTLSRGRSIALEQLEPLIATEGPQWLSLQKGPGSEQLDALNWRNRFHPKQHLVDDCWDFQETAGILINCDLVITSDSGLAHLSAGLGRPTWLLLMQIPEWRWGLEGSSTPWYPCMRLFRQQKRNDWAGLIQQQVRPALKQWLKQQQSRQQG